MTSPQPRVGPHNPQAVGQAGHHQDVAKQVGHRTAQLGRRGDKIDSAGNVADAALGRSLSISAGSGSARRQF